MTYTILGASGFIGGRLQKALKASGATCYAPTRNDESIFTRPLGHVFYCIGLTNDYKDRPHDTVEAHVSLLNRILEKASFDRLIYLSSTRLYDGLQGDICTEESNLILNPENPRHIYDLSKALGENLCLIASNKRACAARLSSVYDSTPDATGFLPTLLQRLSREQTFSLDSDAGIARDYVHIADVVQGLIRLLDSTETGIVNIASGENVSNQDIVDTLNAAGCKITLQRHSPREVRPVCSIKKLKALGIQPMPTLDFLQNFMKKRSLHAAR